MRKDRNASGTKREQIFLAWRLKANRQIAWGIGADGKSQDDVSYRGGYV